MRTFLALGLLLAATAFAADEKCPDYTYCQFWTTGECATGTKQSPIASNAAGRQRGAALQKVVVHYAGEHVPVKLTNTSTTLKSHQTIKKLLLITFQGHDYGLDEFHFHTPAEHLIDVWDRAGHRPVAELHLVHKSGAAAVAIAVPIYLGTTPNPALEALKAHGRPAACNSVEIAAVPMGALVPPEIDRYITYDGSLTTPPCSEPVRFVLLENGLTATQAEIDFLRVTMNARTAQYNANPVTFRQ